MSDATAKELGLEALAVGFPRRPCPRGHYGVRSSDGALWRAFDHAHADEDAATWTDVGRWLRARAAAQGEDGGDK